MKLRAFYGMVISNMDEIIEYYRMHKLVLSVLFDSHLVEKILQMEISEEENLFFNTISLDYINDILCGREKNYVLNSYKQALLKEYIISYVSKYKNVKEKKAMLAKCNDILCHFEKVDKRKLRQFYKNTWQIRRDETVKDVDKNSINVINTSVASDYKYLKILCNQHIQVFSLCTDTMCFMSICAFIEECPVLFSNQQFLQNVKMVIEAGQKYRRVSPINDSLIIKIHTFIEKQEQEKQRISELCQKQYMTSLIFAPQFSEVLQTILQTIGKEKFFTTDNFEVFKSVVLDGLKNCAFDKTKKENIRVLLEYFNSEPVASINEIKRELNQLEDTDWEQKNNAFYIYMFELHRQKKLNKVEKLFLLENGVKQDVDLAIYYDIHTFNVVFDQNGDITDLYGFPFTTKGINYLMNVSPEIMENPVYASKIRNIITLQGFGKTSHDIYTENKRILKKIKKLQK